jgi:Protein of unknown function (DUF2946)
MKWFRSNIRQGSRLALFALAVQLVLSFGHFHAIAAQPAPAIQSGATQSGISYAGSGAAPDAVDKSTQPGSDHDSDQQSNDFCAICAVVAMTNASMVATPPPLPLPQAVEFVYLTIIDAKFVDPNSARVAFQPRAPPVS